MVRVLGLRVWDLGVWGSSSRGFRVVVFGVKGLGARKDKGSIGDL